jgi:hypothetical protein
MPEQNGYNSDIYACAPPIWPFLPPHHKLAMKTYIQNLNKMTILAVSKHAQGRAGTVRAVFEPLETQITRW